MTTPSLEDIVRGHLVDGTGECAVVFVSGFLPLPIGYGLRIVFEAEKDEVTVEMKTVFFTDKDGVERWVYAGYHEDVGLVTTVPERWHEHE